MKVSDRIACLVLGAGRSERYGRESKLDAIVGGKRLGDHVPDLLAKFKFAGHVFVGRPGGFVPHSGSFRRVETREPLAGMGHSLMTGIAALSASSCDAVLIALADMPLVSHEHISALIEAYLQMDGAVASFTGEVQTPPAILPFSTVSKFDIGLHDSGARALLETAHLVQAPAPQLDDVDSAKDLARAEAYLTGCRTVHRA